MCLKSSASDNREDCSSQDLLRILFFCGERSQWGYSHLVPLLSEHRIKLVGVVLATQNRWNMFHASLTGEAEARFGGIALLKWFKRLIKALIGTNPTCNNLRLLSKSNVPVLFCNDVNSPESIDHFKKYDADLILCAAYPQIFRSKILSIYPKGAFNSHPSLLPRCRGAHPVFWTIASGETKSGATIHYMNEELDQGDVVAQVEIDLSLTETRLELYDKLVKVIPDLISKFVIFLSDPESHPIAQDHSKATFFRNDREIHHRIFWSEMTASQIYNLVRACDGLAYFWSGSRKIFVYRAEIVETARNITNGILVPPGTVVDTLDKAIVVAARQEFVLLKNLNVRGLTKVRFEIGQILH